MVTSFIFASNLLLSNLIVGKKQTEDKREIYVCYFDDRVIKQSHIETLRKAGTREALEEFCRGKEQVIVEFMPKTYGVFPTFERLKKYLEKRKRLFGLCMKDEAGKYSVPRKQVYKVSDFGNDFQAGFADQAKFLLGSKVDEETRIVFEFEADMFLTVGETSHKLSLPLSRTVPDSVLNKLASSAGVKPKYTVNERNFPSTLEESLRRNETLEFILPDMGVVSWGLPASNSGATSVLAGYFKEFNKRTLEMENAHIELSKEFLRKLAVEDQVWKDMSESEGKKWDSLPESLKLILHSQAEFSPSSLGFNTKEQALSFIQSATLKRVRPSMFAYLYEFTSQGQLHKIGIRF
jgi:hypothetical protein